MSAEALYGLLTVGVAFIVFGAAAGDTIVSLCAVSWSLSLVAGLFADWLWEKLAQSEGESE